MLNTAYCGVDTHRELHVVVVIDFMNNKLGTIEFDNRPAIFANVVKEVKKICGTKTPIWGLEDVGSSGRSLAIYLLEIKESVKEVNAAFGHAYRLSSPTTLKDDEIDAWCVGRALKDLLDMLPNAKPNDVFFTLKQLVNRRAALTKLNSILQTQLHDHLRYTYPSYKKFFSELDSPSSLAFWEKYPSPKCLDGVPIEELRQLLMKNSHNVLSTKAATKIMELVKNDGETVGDMQDTRDSIIVGIVKQLRFNIEQVKALEKELRNIVDSLGYKLETMPGIGLVTAAELIAQIGDIDRFTNSDRLAQYAGAAPKKFSSAGKGKDDDSKQGNRFLNKTLYFLAIQMVQYQPNTGKLRNPEFYAYYMKKVEEDKMARKKALVCVKRLLVRVIYSMMKNKTEYVMKDMPTKIINPEEKKKQKQQQKKNQRVNGIRVTKGNSKNTTYVQT